jgi:uncharacterized membrane protein YfcA
MESATFLVLGLGAGVLSTLAGLGGGMLLLMTLAAWLDPRSALAMTTPAMLAANLHRLWLFRAHFDRKVGGVFLLGAFPGALVGSFVAVALPEWALAWVLLAVSLVAAARGLGWLKWAPGPRALAPAGFGVGALAAAGGAGILVSPVLLAAGVRGDAFIGTASAAACAIHIARILGYGTGGLLDEGTLTASALLAVGLLAGNLVGHRTRGWFGERGMERLTYAVLAVVVVLAIAGVA